MRFVLLLAATALAAQTPVKSGLDAERLARIPVRMKALVDKGDIPGTVTLLAHGGKVAHLEATGWQNIEARKPMRTDSIFQIMSMTKPITGVGIMMLMEEGKLSINDPVEKHLPEFRNMSVADMSADGTVRTLRKPARPITIRDLMTHTSGMSGPHGGLSDLYTKMDRTLGEAVTAFAQAPLEFDPGTRWLYSNTGIATLGRIIEVLADQPFDTFIAERMLKPLGMKDSFFFPPADKVERIAAVYSYKDGKLTPAMDGLGGTWSNYRKGAKYSAPEFGLYSTAPDLFAFYQMMLNHGTYNGRRFLSKQSVDIMTASHTGALQAGHLPGTGFGLTWEVVKDPIGLMTLLSPGTFGHGGAFGTHGWIDRSKDMVGVFMVQRSSDAKNVFFQMAGASVVD